MVEFVTLKLKKVLYDEHSFVRFEALLLKMAELSQPKLYESNYNWLLDDFSSKYPDMEAGKHIIEELVVTSVPEIDKLMRYIRYPF